MISEAKDDRTAGPPVRSPGKQKRLVSATRLEILLGAYQHHLPPKSRILDLGCGNGEISRAVQERFGAEMTCADVENMLEHPYPFHHVDRLAEFPPGHFDVVMINDVLHHIPRKDQLDALRSAGRVARKLLIFDTAPTVTAKVLDVVMNYVVYRGREATPLTHRSSGEWAWALTTIGYKPQVVQELTAPLFYYPLRHFLIVADTSAGQPA